MQFRTTVCACGSSPETVKGWTTLLDWIGWSRVGRGLGLTVLKPPGTVLARCLSYCAHPMCRVVLCGPRSTLNDADL